MPLIFKDIDDETLYEQLVSRLEHIERAFIVRRHIKLHYAKAMPTNVTAAYKQVRVRYNDFFSTFEESLMWFMTVELWSRFTANSKRGLLKLVNTTNSKDIRQEYANLFEKHSEVIDYISTQRRKYLAHADNVKWRDFPNIFDKEYESLIEDIKNLLEDIGEVLGARRRPVRSADYGGDTRLLFNDLLSVIAPDFDVSSLSTQYDKGVSRFLEDQGTVSKSAKTAADL